MATQASVVIQDLTYTEKILGSTVTVSYINGGTAGSEVVTVSSHAITVQIASTSTATQIKAAVDASAEASALVTVTISGTGSNVQKTCKLATTAGGVAVAKASGTFGGTLKLTADTAGVAGNSIRFKFTTGATAGSEAITVSSSDITCQISEGVSTYAQVKTALEASGPAAALIDITFVESSENVARLSHAAAFTALTGGLDAALGVVVNQDLTFTAVATGTSGNGITVSYTTGATAGSEVVTATASSVSIQISNGVSTATQIRTAFNLVSAATDILTCTVSGTGATAQKTVNAAPTASGVGNGANSFYQDNAGTALTSSFVRVNFSCHAGYLKLICDETAGNKGVIYSFDGVNTHGTLLFAQAIELQDAHVSGIWLKYVSAAPAYRLMVVGR